MTFAPSSTDGGMINIGNSVGVGNANFGGQSSASGASSNLGLNLNLGAPSQPSLMLVNLESYDQFMPAWYNDAKASMAAAEANGQRATTSPDGSVITSSTSSSTSSSSLMNLKESYPATFKRRGGKVIGTYRDANGKT